MMIAAAGYKMLRQMLIDIAAYAMLICYERRHLDAITPPPLAADIDISLIVSYADTAADAMPYADDCHDIATAAAAGLRR